MEDSLYLIISLVVEGQDFPFTVYDQTQCHGLYASGRKLRLDLSPEYRGKFEADQAVKDTTGLLGIDQIHVYFAWIFDRVENGGLCNLLKDYASGVLLLESQRLEKMP